MELVLRQVSDVTPRSKQEITPTTKPVFTLSSVLPTEIRLQIWEIIFHQPRIYVILAKNKYYEPDLRYITGAFRQAALANQEASTVQRSLASETSSYRCL